MDVIAILEKLNQHDLVKLNRRMNDWYSITCPFHNNGMERRPSCGVSLVSQTRNGVTYPEGNFHCFTCGATYSMEDGVNEILKNHHIGQTGREWLEQNVPGYSPASDFEYLVPDATMKLLASKYAVNQIQRLTQPEQTYISEEELASYRYIVPYMYERKLTNEIIEKYDIGYDANWIPPGRKNKVPCITIPVRDRDGHTLFLCRRSIQGKLYNYPQGVQKPVFGIDMIPEGTTSLVICESAINALTAISYGYSAVALLGTGDSYQIQQLKELGVSDYILCYDGDDAGRRGAQRMKKQLKNVALVWTINMPDGKDLNDCTKEEFDKLYMERE